MADTKISALTAATTPLAGTEVLPIVQSGATKQVSVANLTAGRDVDVASVTANKTVAGSSVPIYAKNLSTDATADVSAIFQLAQAGGAAKTAFQVLVDKDDTWGSNTSTDAKVYLQVIESNVLQTIATLDGNGDVGIALGNLVQGTAAKGINFTANTPAAGMTSQLLNWYEEGTWTPVLSRSGGAVTVTYTTQVGSYVRIGKLVFIKFNITWTGLSGSSGYYKVTGLPFTVTSGSAYEAISVIDIAGITFTAGYTQIGCEVRPSTTELYVLQAGSNVTSATFTSGFAAAGTLIASGCYRID